MAQVIGVVLDQIFQEFSPPDADYHARAENEIGELLAFSRRTFMLSVAYWPWSRTKFYFAIAVATP
jgi:hypothetical protein